MPLSNRVFDEKVEQFLLSNNYKYYFDIGCGAGKYGKMIKKIKPNSFVLGIECEQSYIKKYETEKFYDELVNDKIENFIHANPGFHTEVAIMGDLIEHLFKSQGLDL